MPRPPRPAARGRAVLGLHPLEDRTTPALILGAPLRYNSGGDNFIDVAAGDLTNDGFPELVGLSASGVRVRINNGSGGFTGPPVSINFFGGVSVDIADIDGDLKRDIVVGGGANAQVYVIAGKGDGTFQAPLAFNLGAAVNDAVVADFNRDNLPDIATASGDVRVLLNTGADPLFKAAPAIYRPPTDEATTIAAGDFNGDGFPDLAVSGNTWGKVAVLLNNRDGTFLSPLTVNTKKGLGVELTTADLNRDSRDDVVLVFLDQEPQNTGDDPPAVPPDPAPPPDLIETHIAVFLAGPAGTLNAPTYLQALTNAIPPVPPVPVPPPPDEFGVVAGVTVADFDLDGKPDIISGLDSGTPQGSFFRGDGAGGFASPVAVDGIGDPAWALVAVDVNGDGKPDLAAAEKKAGGDFVVRRNLSPRLEDFVVDVVPAAAEAGQPFTVTVTARNDYGVTLAEFEGTVLFSAPDDPLVGPGNGLPAAYTFVPADGGSKTFTLGFELRTAGLQTVRVRDGESGKFGTDTVTVDPAAAARFAVTSGPTGTVTAGDAQSFTVTARDTYGNPVTGGPNSYNGPLTVLSTDAAAVYPGTGTLIDGSSVNFVNGSATVPVEFRTAGSRTLTFRDGDPAAPALADVTATVAVAAAAPAAVAVVSGSGQSAAVDTPFANPLRVRVTDRFGNRVAGAPVAFSAPLVGGRVPALFPADGSAGAAILVATGSDGEAATPARAGTLATAGYAVRASNAVATTEALFSLTNTPGPVDELVVVDGDNQATEVSLGGTPSPFAAPLRVRVLDAFDNPIDGVSVTFSAVPSDRGAAATFPGNPAVTGAGGSPAGVAALTPEANTVSGAYAITAAAGGKTAAFRASNSAGPVQSVAVFAGNNQRVTVGTPFAGPVVVRAADANGNPAAGVEVRYTGLANPSRPGAGATFTGGTAATTDADGLARFLVEANTVAGSYDLSFTRFAGGVPVGTTVTATLTNLPGALSRVVRLPANSGTGQTGPVNVLFPNPLRARAEDALGNPIPGVVVRFAVSSATAAGAVFPDGADVATDADGLAVARVRANTVAGPYQVTATAAGATEGASYALANTPGPAKLFVPVAGDGAAATVGTDYAGPITLRVEDGFGNGVPSAVVTFSAPAAGPSVSFPNGLQATADAAGLVSLAVPGRRLAANTVAGSFLLTATTPGENPGDVVVGTVGLTNQAGPAVVFTSPAGGGQTATVNTAFANKLAVTVRDQYGNGVPGLVVRFAGPTTGPGVAFLSGPATEVPTDSSGRAEAAPGANTLAGSYIVTATVPTAGGVTPVTFALSNVAGAAELIAVATGAGQSAEVEATYANPLVARVTDRFGNPVAGVEVRFDALTTGPAVTFPDGSTPATGADGLPRLRATATTGANGLAQVRVAANGVSGAVAVTAEATGTGRPVAFALTNTPGVAVGVAAVSGGGQRARVGTDFLDPLVVAAVDRLGNPVPNARIRVQDAGQTTLGTAELTTGTAGTASFPVRATTAAGSYAVTFTGVGLAGTAQFALTNTAGPAVALATVSGDGTSAAAGEPFPFQLRVRATDQFGNPAPGVAVVFSAPVNGPTVTFPFGNTATTNSFGLADVAVVAGPLAGPLAVTAAANGAGTVRFNLTATPAAPASVAIAGGNGQKAETNTPFAQPLVVAVADRFGNPVPGVAVTFTPSGVGAGAAVAEQVTTGPDGRASYAARTGDVAGPVAVTAAVAGVAPVTFALTASPPPTGLVGTETTLVGPGAGTAGPVRVLNPDGSEKTTFNPFPGFAGGTRVAAADFNNDGTDDYAAGTGPGAAVVVVYDGSTGKELFRVLPFGDFAGGVFLSAGDLDGDGAAELVVSPDVGGGPRVVVYRGRDFQKVADFFGIDDPNFRGGARTAVGDFNRDGAADLVVAAGVGGGPRLAAYDGFVLATSGRAAKLFNDIFVFEQRLRDGVYVAAGDVDGDGIADLIAGGGPGGAPRVLVLSGADLLAGNGPPRFVANFFAGSLDDRSGVRVAAKNLDGDNRADLVVGTGSRVQAYYGDTITSTGVPPLAFGMDGGPNVIVG